MGPGDVGHERQAILRLAQPVKQWQDVIAAKIDQLGMFCWRRSPAVLAGDRGFCRWRRKV
jgi:hypothetical protein